MRYNKLLYAQERVDRKEKNMLKRKLKEAIECLKEIEIHSKAPFAQIDPRTNNLKWLNYINKVANSFLRKIDFEENYSSRNGCEEDRVE